VKPVLFLTGNVPAYRVGALARLHEAEGIELATFGGRSLHGGPNRPDGLPFPHREITPAQVFGLASSGAHRAVICSTAGRTALLGGWAGARRAGVPLILWASLWAHPRSAAHALSYPLLRRLYASADAVVTYGPHVSAYVAERGARTIRVAPQSVDNDFWRSQEFEPPPFTGWQADAAGLPPEQAALLLAGPGPGPSVQEPGAVLELGPLSPRRLRDLYAACEVLVVPSVRTRTFREPWGLVVNEAMNRSLAVIASDAVGAAGGGLVRDGENGIVVPAGDSDALAAAIVRLAREPRLRARLGEAGAETVLDFSHAAWAAGFSEALGTVGLARGHW
jgi:hypothetical protein